MSDRQKTHNGRDVDGRFRVRQADVEELLEDPRGVDFIRDDVRLGGAVADTGIDAAQTARHVGDLIEDNRSDVARATGKPAADASKRSRRG